MYFSNIKTFQGYLKLHLNQVKETTLCICGESVVVQFFSFPFVSDYNNKCKAKEINKT